MGRDGRRTLLVLGQTADLFIALRECLESPLLAVRWAAAGSLESSVSECVPWPWGLAIDAETVPVDALQGIASKPVLCFCLGAEPRGLPWRSFGASGWTALAAEIEARLRQVVHGLTLAPNRGTNAANGSLILSPELEALVAAYPDGVRLAPGTRETVALALRRNRAGATISLRGDDSVLAAA